MRILSVLLALVLAMPVLLTPALAQVYKRVDEHGRTYYSDKPEPGAKEIYVPPVQTISAPPVRSTTPAPDAAPAAGQAKPKASVSYKIAIVSPANDSTVHQNDGSISVTARVDPPLKGEDRVQFLLNGAAQGKPAASTTTTIPFVDRGTHTIGANVVNASGTVRASAEPVTVHLKRFAIKPPPPNPPPPPNN